MTITIPIWRLKFVTAWATTLQDRSCPREINQFGRTILRAETDRRLAQAHLTNAATEAMNNLIKRVQVSTFRPHASPHFRVRVLLCAGKLNWDLPATITPR